MASANGEDLDEFRCCALVAAALSSAGRFEGAYAPLGEAGARRFCIRCMGETTIYQRGGALADE